MQLENEIPNDKKNKKSQLSIASQLALAVGVLSGSDTNAKNEAEVPQNEWRFVGSILAYDEPDRVSAVEGILMAEKDFDDTAKLTYKFVLDSLTGASANGALPQQQVQTFTRPSGKGQYTVSAGDIPLDDTFKDTRAQFNVSWSDLINDDSRYTLGSNLSKEYDYLSISFNAELAKEFDRKNTTLSIGGSIAFDNVDPEGGIPLALSSMVVDEGQFTNRDDYWDAFYSTRAKNNDSIETIEILAGWTQVVSRRMIMQFNYSYANVSGYLSDPFKIISSVDDSFTAQAFIYEKRPRSREQHTIFTLAKYHLDDSVLNFSYRYLQDDWQINSHTLDLKWHLFHHENSFWEPHFRYYHQSAAQFYVPYLNAGQALPEFASADYRIGEMTTTTLGLKYGFISDTGNRSEIRAEYYLQKPQGNSMKDIPQTNRLELNPEVKAFILQYTYFW